MVGNMDTPTSSPRPENEPRWEVLSGGYYTYAACPWPGEIAELPSPDFPGKVVLIFTDRKVGGGCVSTVNTDWKLGSEVANFWQQRAEEGHAPGDVFDRLVHDLGAKEVRHVDDLTTLSALNPF